MLCHRMAIKIPQEFNMPSFAAGWSLLLRNSVKAPQNFHGIICGALAVVSGESPRRSTEYYHCHVILVIVSPRGVVSVVRVLPQRCKGHMRSGCYVMLSQDNPCNVLDVIQARPYEEPASLVGGEVTR